MTSANAAGLIGLLLRQSDRHPIRSIGAADLQAYDLRIVRSLRNLGILTEREDLRDDGATVFQVVDDALVVVDPETGACERYGDALDVRTFDIDIAALCRAIREQSGLGGPGPAALSTRVWRLGRYEGHGRAAEVCLVRRLTLPRGRGYGADRRGHVVDYRHVIHALRAKPGALPGLVYRDQLFPRDAYRRLYDAAMEALPERAACKLVVGALAIAHERGCEADLAALIDASLDAGAIPDLADLRARFAPDPEALPQVTVTLTPLSAYDVLTAAPAEEGASA